MVLPVLLVFYRLLSTVIALCELSTLDHVIFLSERGQFLDSLYWCTCTRSQLHLNIEGYLLICFSLHFRSSRLIADMNNKNIVGGKLASYLVSQEKGLLLMNFLFFKGEVHPKMITSYLVVFGALSQMVNVRGAYDKAFWIYRWYSIHVTG